jgi:two-component system cell cycle sensor histidine kinase/response regulator CckA
VRADGSEFPLEATVSKFEAGGRTFYTVVVRDVTERRRTEEHIRQQAALLDKAGEAIHVRDLAGRVSYWNRGAERLYGWAREGVAGRPAGDLLGVPGAEPDDAARAMAASGEWRGELRRRTKDGREVIVESHWTLVRDDSGRPASTLVIDSDVTERKRLEAQYLHAQRMESIGRLAGGVAHDFNNLLTVINGYSEMAMGKLEAEQPVYALVREVHRAGERAAALTRRLLAFSRKQILQPVVLDVNGLVAEGEKLLRRLIGEDIDLATALQPGLGRVKADPGEVEQVLINMAVNARDAMPRGGQLTIETRDVDLDEEYARLHADARPGRYVLIAVSDTGVGMDAATKARVFEPFFTTKEVGKGTGLGLSTVYGIVRQSGGHIEVYSEPGRGTTFKVYLPRVKDTPSASAPQQTPSPRGTETILLAEDEPAARSMMSLALRSLGYVVLEAGDGEVALRVCREYHGGIDLLVTDVVMPNLGGRDLATQLHVLRPQTRVLYLSGYTDDAVFRHGVLEPGTAFLPKPVTPSALARKVRETLDGPASERA